MALTQGPDGTPAFEELRERLRARRRDFETAAAKSRPGRPDEAFVLKPFVPAPRAAQVRRSSLSAGLVLTALAVAATVGWIGYYAVQSARDGGAPAEVAVLEAPSTTPAAVQEPAQAALPEPVQPVTARDDRLRPATPLVPEATMDAARDAQEAARRDSERLAAEGAVDDDLATGAIPAVRDVTPRFGASTTGSEPVAPLARAPEAALREEPVPAPDETEVTAVEPTPDSAFSPFETEEPAAANARDEGGVPEATAQTPPDRAVGALDPAPATDAPTQTPAASGATGSILNAVNMRASPENGAPVVSVLRDGAMVEVIACDLWCEIVVGGKRGFVFKSFIAGRG